MTMQGVTTQTPTMPGFNTLLVGATGSGKTHVIRTLVEAGITPFVIFTEPGMATLGDTDPSEVHWHYIPPAAPSWDALLDSANKINSMNFEMLTKLKDINKKEYGQWLKLITLMNDFTCQRTGESFGDVATWDHTRAIVIDSLSGLNTMAMDLVVGSKPTKAMSDWGVAMDNLERFLIAMCGSTKCHFVLTAHLERLVDEVMGGVTLMPSTLGKKLAPKIPRFFDDVILCEREGTKFSWNTARPNADLKARYVPISDQIIPSFVQIANEWRTRAGVSK